VLLPTWAIIHKRYWKMQLAYLSRRYRVATFDGRGNGRPDRPSGVEPYVGDEYVGDTLAVLDATGTERAVLVACSCGALWGRIVAADHAQRCTGIVSISSAVGLVPGHPERQVVGFEDHLETTDGWAKYNAHYWRRSYREFLEYFSRSASASRTRRSRSRTASGGAWTPTRRRSPTRTGRSTCAGPNGSSRPAGGYGSCTPTWNRAGSAAPAARRARAE